MIYYKYFVNHVQQVFTMPISCYTGSASNTGAALINSDSTSTATHIPYQRFEQESKQSLRKRRREEKKIDDAVYGYIQAIRALNRTVITSYQISKALDLPYWQVTNSIERLQNQGIKINRLS